MTLTLTEKQLQSYIRREVQRQLEARPVTSDWISGVEFRKRNNLNLRQFEYMRDVVMKQDIEAYRKIFKMQGARWQVNVIEYNKYKNR